MEVIFTGYNIEISKENEKYYLTFDEGRFAIKYRTIEITKEEALKAQESAEASYQVVIDFQNKELNLKKQGK